MSSMLFSSRELASITEHQVALQLFFHGEEKDKLVVGEQGKRTEELVVIDRRGINGFSLRKTEEVVVMEEEEECSSQSSSIGADTSSSSEEEEEDAERGEEVQSNLKDEGLFGSLASLEESLPIKRGLSNFFPGKSKSFASLSDAACGNARDLVKQENPFNKRRRIQMSCKASWRRRASCSSLMASLPPLLSHDLAVNEGKEEEDEDERGGDFPLASLHSHGGERGSRKSFNTHRSFSLSDFQNV